MLATVAEEHSGVLSLVSSPPKTVLGCTSPQPMLRGIVCGRSVRSSYAILHVAKLPEEEDGGVSPDNTDSTNNITSDDDEDDHILVRIQFVENPRILRSHCRRFCKMGDLIEIPNTITIQWQSIESSVAETTEWLAPRLVIPVKSSLDVSQFVVIVQRQLWSMPKCQTWQRQHFRTDPPHIRQMSSAMPKKACSGSQNQENRKNLGSTEDKVICHRSGLGKREQGIFVENFLLHMIENMLHESDKAPTSGIPPHEWANSSSIKDAKGILEHLNRGSGVYDVAGGSGHVSMALAMVGVRATVVDPRENVGRLPGRDRKLYKHALKQRYPAANKSRTSNYTSTGTSVHASDGLSTEAPGQSLYCQPVAVPFEALRAWFGTPPIGVDASFRHPDQKTVSDCLVMNDPRLVDCTAIVALHPDEATEAIVDTAVKLQIPFLVVPCCVFYRLFPNRRNASGDPVSTYSDFLDFLQAKHVSIQRTKLPFLGANTVLWSTF